MYKESEHIQMCCIAILLFFFLSRALTERFNSPKCLDTRGAMLITFSQWMMGVVKIDC